MLKKYRGLLIVTSFIILIPMLIGFGLWDQLPDQIPTHWNMQGEIDGYSSKLFAIVVLPLILVGVQWLCTLGTLADPKNKNIADKLWKLVLWICPVISLLLGYITYGTVLGMQIDINAIMPIFMGLLFMVIGNYLPKCKQSYTVGIKIPWTLNSEENWNKTHRFAGPCWMIAGFLSAVLGMLGLMVPMLICLIVMVFVPVVYSYMYYVKYEKDKEE
ncbi:MAG: SdpI family protein [Erysipelotrichaceae bacterium]|nr:SdpI family protein [Erysipelotrichaceae bacterium]